MYDFATTEFGAFFYHGGTAHTAESLRDCVIL